jgi:hypothetical protein
LFFTKQRNSIEGLIVVHIRRARMTFFGLEEEGEESEEVGVVEEEGEEDSKSSQVE